MRPAEGHAPPRRLAGRYELRGAVGRAGPAAITAFDHALRREVVVRLASDRGAIDDGQRPLRRYADALVRLEHPGAVTCHDRGEDADLGAWVAVATLQGSPLRELLRRRDLTVLRAAELVLRVAEVVAHAHQRGVAHGRLDVDAVCVGDGGDVVVDGWGGGELTAGDVPPGAVDVDLQGLADLTRACLDGVAAGRPSRARAELTAIATVASSPGGYADVGAFVEDLRALVDGHVVRAHARGAFAEICKWVGRHRLLAASIALLAFTALAAALAAIVARAQALTRLATANAALAAAETEALLAAEAAGRATDAALGLGDETALHRLLSAAEVLWPAVTQDLAAYDCWLERARPLTAARGIHAGRLAEVERSLADPGRDAAPLPVAQARAWLRDVLAELIAELDRFADPTCGELAQVQRRREQAAALVERSVAGPTAARAWMDVQRELETTVAYRGWQGPSLQPQVGLMPLGTDPTSGLFEFAHLPTGVAPERNPESGALVLRPECGAVLVLLPGGVFTMGAQAGDARAANWSADAMAKEQPVHEVVVAPFFCAKHELTRAQWARLCSAEDPADPLMPAAGMSWSDCDRVLPRGGLRLPTEAQWEYAARGGTNTPWWTGPQSDSLRGAENIRDLSHAKNGHPWYDGWPGAAPVDAFRPSPFGLHHVLGNVSEWCRDCASPYFMPVRCGDGERLPGAEERRVARGGNASQMAADSRASARKSPPATWAHAGYGVRPVRSLR